MSKFGVFAGNEPTNVTTFETWMGRKVDCFSVHVGEASWQDFTQSVQTQLTHFGSLDRDIVLSIPLLPHGATLQEAAGGAYNSYYTQAARVIASARREPVLYVRTGWEQNGDWMTWAAKGKEAAFVTAFQSFTSCFRLVSDRFHMVWCPNIGQNDPASTYPGDAYADVIGLDVYHNPQWDPKGQVDAWDYMVQRQYGLQWHLEFARARSRPIAFPEWGVSSDNFGWYIARLAKWFQASDVVYHVYWDSNAAYAGALSNGQYPQTGTAFRAAFGR